LFFLLVACFGYLDAQGIKQQNDVDDRYLEPEWFGGKPGLKNIQIRLQNMAWASEDLDKMETMIEALVAKKPEIFQAAKDLRAATDSKAYVHQFSQ